MVCPGSAKVVPAPPRRDGTGAKRLEKRRNLPADTVVRQNRPKGLASNPAGPAQDLGKRRQAAWDGFQHAAAAGSATRSPAPPGLSLEAPAWTAPAWTWRSLSRRSVRARWSKRPAPHGSLRMGGTRRWATSPAHPPAHRLRRWSPGCTFARSIRAGHARHRREERHDNSHPAFARRNGDRGARSPSRSPRPASPSRSSRRSR